MGKLGFKTLVKKHPDFKKYQKKGTTFYSFCAVTHKPTGKVMPIDEVLLRSWLVHQTNLEDYVLMANCGVL